MLKLKQFMIRYYNWKLEEILKRESQDGAHEAIQRIDRAIHGYEIGIVTVDEVMRTISEA